jgi:hypothetical protein
MGADKFIDILGPHKIAYLTCVQRRSAYLLKKRKTERERRGGGGNIFNSI